MTPRRTVLALALLLAAVLPAQAPAAGKTLLMPGVTYERQVQFTTHGPVAVHVITAPRPGGLWRLKPVLSNGTILGRERVTDMQRDLGRDATVAGVNGDLFAWADGRPTGVFMRDGVLAHPPTRDRSSLGITPDGQLHVDRIRFYGTWRGTGQRRPLDLNQAPGPNGISLFTPLWGPRTPALQNAVEVVLRPFPAATPNVDIATTVAEVRTASAGSTPVPADGAVISAQGRSAERLLAEAPLGAAMTVRLLFSPSWAGVADALGGGPVLVRNGKPVFRHFEGFTSDQLGRDPRTGVGQLKDGRVVLVVVDGRRPGYSVGLTSFELAQTLARLGAVTATGLDAGGSSTMAFEGKLLNRPSDPGGERPVAEGLFVLYDGVWAAPAAEQVLSPNGDGVSEAQTLSVKLVRPSRLEAALLGPGGVRRVLDEGDRAAGAYRYTWTGAAPDGAPEPEGRWRLAVTAVDDLGRTSRADRWFALDRTLAALSVTPSTLPVRPKRSTARARIRFALTRPAKVAVTIETPTGAIVAVAARASLAAGEHTLQWNGRAGRRTLVRTGRYVVRVRASSAVGRVSLAAPLAVRRVALRR